MDLFDAISKRHSYRGSFTDAPVLKEDLIRIVETGIKAPSGCNAQTTDFVIVDKPELISQIAKIVEKPFIKTAQAVIVCIIEPRGVYRGLSFEVEDCSAAVENMLLAITALGYASVWIDGNIRVDGKAEILNKLLGIPAPKYVRIILPIGVPAESREQQGKKAISERAFFNIYGNGS
jgi:nitroreductase